MAGDPVGGRAQVGERVGQLVVAVEGCGRRSSAGRRARPRGSGSEASSSSSTIHIPARPCQTLRRGLVEAVVVVPLERGAFGPAVLAQVVDVGFALARLEQQVVAGRARRESRAGCGSRRRCGWDAGQAAGLAVELGAVVAAVQVDGQLAGLGRQLVVEGDLGALARRGGGSSGPGSCRRRSTSASSRPGRICASASRIGISICEPVSSRGIGSGARNGTAASRRSAAPRRAASSRPGRRPSGSRWRARRRPGRRGKLGAPGAA